MSLDSTYYTEVLQSTERRAYQRALELSQIAERLHRTTPRLGAMNYRTGKRASIAGNAPAVQTGELLRRIQQRPKKVNGGYQVILNYEVLETYHNRPLKALALAELTRQIEGRNGR